jgi:hypothetical protein
MPAPASELTSVESGQPSDTDAKHPSSAQKEYIYVPDNFKVKEGARLTDNLVVGKALGVGLQVLVKLNCRCSRCIISAALTNSLCVGWCLPVTRQRWQG